MIFLFIVVIVYCNGFLMNVFKDKDLTLYYFSENILVHCPKCNKKAEIKNNWKNYGDAEIFCNNCGYHDKNDKKYYDLTIKDTCEKCKSRIIKHIFKVKSPKGLIKVTCGKCNFNCNCRTTYSYYNISYADVVNGVDYLFDADLWLRKEYKNNIFWATNYEHLEYLKQYISADIRARTDGTYATMIEKLPKFIKSAKNRDKLLHIIKELENK